MGSVLLYIKLTQRKYKKGNFRLTSLTNLELKVFTLTHMNQTNEFNDG